ncbi:MAG TPA: TonB-dependent receptor plug domain-containing protein [Flavobacteriales bacterium]|nr:TonB-dependent receptor plug domain-containing protein [Flavobacteriales bacterium]
MKRRTKIGLMLTMLISPAANALFAQQSPGEIHGKILDNGIGVLGAMVWVNASGGAIKTMVDEEGNGSFILKPLEAGTYILHIKNDLDTFKLEVMVTAGTITRMPATDLASPELVAQKMGEVTIIHWKQPLICAECGSMEIVDSKQLKHSPVKRDIKQLVATMTSGVKVDQNGDAYVRGSRADAINYYIDGMRLPSTNFKTPPSTAIASVQVYTGGVPAKYGDCTGGVVAIETQSYFNLYNEWVAQQNATK